MCKQTALHIGRDYKRQTELAKHFKPLGIELHKAPSLKTARLSAQKHNYSVIIINYDSANNDIFDFCSFIRSGNTHAIITVFMSKINIAAEEKLFDAGVNDVVIGKQSSAKILIKRIQARLRHCTKSNWLKSNTVRLKNTIIDFENRDVWCNGTIRRLPGILADLLKYFIENPGHIITREELKQSPIWSESICSSADEGGKTFDVNISKLKKIIEPNPAKPQIILSVRSIGWKLAADALG